MFENIKTKELKISELFNFSFSVFLANIKIVSVVALLITVIVTGIYYTYVLFIETPLEASLEVMALQLQGGYPQPYMDMWPLFNMMILSGVAIVVVGCMPLPLTTLMGKAIKEEECTISDIFSGFKKFLKYFATLILAALIFVGIGIMALFGEVVALLLTAGALSTVVALVTSILLIYLFVSFWFFSYIVSYTNIWGIKALMESRRLVKGKVGKTFLLGILAGLFALMIFSVITAILGAFVNNILVDFAREFLFTLVMCYFVLVNSLWFLNRHYS